MPLNFGRPWPKLAWGPGDRLDGGRLGVSWGTVMLRRFRFMLVLAGCLLAGCLLAPSVHALEVNCTDGLDDDGDGPVDCADTDCWRDAACEESVTRTFTVQRSVPADPSTRWLNIYLVSWPEIPNIPDIGNNGASGGPKGCVGEPGGPTAGDGIIDSVDAVCVIWTTDPLRTNGALVLSRFDTGTCQFHGTQVSRATIGGVAWGSLFFPIVPHEGYYLTISSRESVAPVFTPTLRGWRDAGWRGDSVIAQLSCEPSLRILQVPYDTLATTVDEILCGEEGIDWQDVNADGKPDTCPNGLFDGTTPISIGSVDNDPTLAPTGNQLSDNAFIYRSVLLTGLELSFLGPRIAVVPGDAFLLVLRDSQQPTSWIDPRR